MASTLNNPSSESKDGSSTVESSHDSSFPPSLRKEQDEVGCEWNEVQAHTRTCLEQRAKQRSFSRLEYRMVEIWTRIGPSYEHRRVVTFSQMDMEANRKEQCSLSNCLKQHKRKESSALASGRKQWKEALGGLLCPSLVSRVSQVNL